ncbi:hypothetical protein BU23DRAFT_652630 [Bimuria novae-zelandiae CBS 107.79]|uniref:Uncharacterized protein n=1 Tax=Bimuria novae-zelandiae CBS 107.79 TaxID=1447943 RepID=A0A6A5UYN9_9PLEO|nr:hypothetical protein BU23DRAFT_652630 [Bimuria novae-zelandiae CBS 107.79]
MARIHLEAPWTTLPQSPRHGQLRPGNAAIQWACGRRGRVAIVTVLLFVVVFFMAVARRSEVLSASYRTIYSNYYQLSLWRPHLPQLPSSIPTSLRKPSSTALQLENGTITHPPSKLHKLSPNFHLLLSAPEHDLDFCKTFMSAMVMNYPPPTIVSLFGKPEKKSEWEQEKLKGALSYLEDQKVVKDNDLVMLVDGRDTWFQLPSQLMIKQYIHVVADANRQVQKVYGRAFTQTIMFGARKTCEGDDVACSHMPSSILPKELYRPEGGLVEETARLPARYLDADMVVGPVKDLRVLFQAAAKLFEEKKSQNATLQSVMSILFGEQMLAREMHKKAKRPMVLKVYDHFAGALARPNAQGESSDRKLDFDRQYEFSIGLDYTHALFQPLTDCVEDELLATTAPPSDRGHARNSTSFGDLPPAFINATGPFWRVDESSNDPSPNDKAAYIDKLEYRYELDKLPRRDTPWSSVSLIQNKYTDAIPATFQVTYRRLSSKAPRESASRESIITGRRSHIANITWTSLWYSGYERALLRRYFRTPQSAMGYHTAAVGGDLLWDQRGGRGGVWTAESALWLPWGEVDGVCGTYELLKDIFGDKKGVWLHEDEDGGGKQGRGEAEEKLKKHIEEETKRDKEWMENMEKERLEKEQEEKEREVKERQEREAKNAKEKEAADKQASEAAAAQVADAQASALEPEEQGESKMARR